MKVKEFENYLKEANSLGDYRAVLYTIEFQKRGLPHCHTLLWVDAGPNGLLPEDIDRFISAELPDPKTDPQAYKVVSEMMMHGPCDQVNLRSPCMEGYTCTKRFPKPYNDTTYFDKHGYVHYRRRKSGIVTRKGNVELDSTYVVPYNRMLCLIFNAHINVEYCGWNMLIKYLFKYISKGTDRIAMRISRPIGQDDTHDQRLPSKVDEIQNFIDGRFICAHEASWRIFGFPIHHREPAVLRLAVHLEGRQVVTFRSQQPLRSIVNDPVRKKTSLTEWLYFNQHSSEGHHLTYIDFPTEFVWYANDRGWSRRRNLNKPTIGRLSYMHPATGEVFYLRMLLCHQKGCKSFDDIRTVNGTVYLTYRQACEAIGLLGDDSEWETTIQEASISATCNQLRSLIVHILMFCEVVNPLRLWSKTWPLMGDDIPIRAAASLHMNTLYVNPPELEQYVLCEVELLLNRENKTVTDYGLPPLSLALLEHLQNRLLMEERNYDREELSRESEIMRPKMNEKHKIIFDLVVDAFESKKQEFIFVYGIPVEKHNHLSQIKR